MEHAPSPAACGLALLPQNSQGVIAGAAGVDHQRFGRCLRGADVHPKALALPLHIGHAAPVEAVIVQPGLADGHHPGQCGALHQVIEGGFGHVFAVGVNAHRSPEIRVVRGQTVHLRKSLERGGNAQSPCHAGLRHRGADIPDLLQ